MTEPTGLVDVTMLSRLLNLTPQRVSQLTKEGVIPKASRGKYPLIQCVQGYIKFLQARVNGASAAGTGAGGPGYYAARTRREDAMAHMAELELDKLRGSLVDRAAYDREVASVHIQFRDALVAMCSRVAPLIAAETDAAKCRIMMLTEVSSALSLLGTAEAVPNG